MMLLLVYHAISCLHGQTCVNEKEALAICHQILILFRPGSYQGIISNTVATIKDNPTLQSGHEMLVDKMLLTSIVGLLRLDNFVYNLRKMVQQLDTIRCMTTYIVNICKHM